MKNLRISGVILLCVISLHLTAQVAAPVNAQPKDKPFLFAALAEKFPISRVSLDKLFEGSSAGTVKLAIENNKFLEGVVMERVERNFKMATVNIRLSEYDQALFTITRKINHNAAVQYSGRIININYADILVLKEENQALYLVKEKQSLFLTE